MAATSSLQPLHALSSLDNLHSPSLPSHDPNPSSNPSLPTNLVKESIFALSSHCFTVYPTFPHFSHLDSVSLFGASKDRLIGAQSTSLRTPNPALQLKFEREPNFGLSFARFSNVDLIPLSEAVGLEIERDEEIVIRADSVKKKRKRKMNKHKLKKLRKKLRRKS
ncbi:hypothetical protein FCM35_KLT18063 [Carex littledalei]|uniref:Small ribosomal subunit protein mS38 n=1 Tax=Carex littledalei TaxID=544730 RepID=A0A833RKF5_9POAL|nr:hypothetical protein FCM35_KLT18063 [Carex littledalei]